MKGGENTNLKSKIAYGFWLSLLSTFLVATVTILVSNLSRTDKAIGALALVIMVYIAYNEFTKHFSKSRSKYPMAGLIE